MTRLLGVLLLALPIALLFPTHAWAGADAPEWLERAASTKINVDTSKSPAVVLLDEHSISVANDGRAECTWRYAVKVLTPDGRREAIGARTYRTDSDKVRSIRGWVLRPNGAVKELKDDATLDLAAAENDVYNETRIRSVVGSGEAEPGAIFGFECRIEQGGLFKAYEWYFQKDLPVVQSRLVVTAPEAWTVRAHTFNHDEIRPIEQGPTRTWELHNLPPIPDEPARPPTTSLSPRIAISLLSAAPAGAKARSFDTWEAVARWLLDVTTPMGTATPRLAERARALTAGQTDPIAKTRAIGAFVQGINYISIQMGLGRGGGYVPHAADAVLAKSYGDCKDKANLMKTLLGTVGVESHLVLVYHGDRSYVRDAWPAAEQFNHCILAVRVASGTPGPVLDHPELGPLLLFDPTDSNTRLGDLPESEQGSLALLITSAKAPLARLPVLPSEQNRASRESELVLDATGRMHVQVREMSHGQAASFDRRVFRSRSPAAYRAEIERWIGRNVPQATIVQLEPRDSFDEGTFGLTLELDAPRYARSMAGGLLLFRTTFLDRLDQVALTESERTLPVLLEDQRFKEETRIELPPGYVADDLPEPVRLSTAFGTYDARVTHGDQPGKLLATREVVLRRGLIPASDYAAVRSFFEGIRSAEQAVVALTKE